MPHVLNWLKLHISRIRFLLSGPHCPDRDTISAAGVISHPAAEELRSLISEAKDQASEAQNTLGDLGVRIQDVIDAADAELPLVSYMAPPSIEGLALQWNQIAEQTTHIRFVLEDVQPTTDTVSGTATLTSVTTSGVISRNIAPYIHDPNFDHSWGHFIEVTSRPEKKLEVIRLMKAFRLDIPPAGSKSPLDLFQTAHQAFEAPVSKSNPVSTSLIPMREAVEASLDELLRLRPEQQAGGHGNRKKIAAICAQLKKDSVTDLMVQEWADQWHDINDKDLSSSKRQHITREEWSRRLNRATLFLYSLLIGLDSSRLRR